VWLFAAEDAPGLPQIDEEKHISLRVSDEIGVASHVSGEEDALIENIKVLMLFIDWSQRANLGQMSTAGRDDADLTFRFHDLR